MIKLNRPPIPASLKRAATGATNALWNEWQKTGETPVSDRAIYAHIEVKSALRKAQHWKCAYCETLNPTSHDVVEHFRPKAGWRQARGDKLQRPQYFWLSYEWKNLLFACDQCNDGAHKQNLFPLSNPGKRAFPQNPSITGERPLLINPYTTEPKNHVEWNEDIPRRRNRSHRGRVTIEVFGLDQDGLLMDQRRKHYKETEATLELIESYSAANKVRSAVRDTVLLPRIEDSAPWAAMIRESFGSRIQGL
ncbi:MAG: hypothetical protein ACI8UO_002523 [Verrucomicrobiales bacterium]|jgi:uncharacterized protein (TIGR02646 family)